MAQPRSLDAVLFDWRGTLVDDPPDEWWVRRALERCGRAADEDHVAEICAALTRAADLPEVRAATAGCDCSQEAHRAYSSLYFRRAGLDDEFADALYALDLEAESHPFYPDALPVVRELHERGCRIALVSDIHVDLRPEFVAAGFDGSIDAYVLSFEHGVQKPGRRIFEIALEALDVDASRALMVGDSASHDGGAIKAGISTWLLPEGGSADRARGLDRLLAFFP